MRYYTKRYKRYKRYRNNDITQREVLFSLIITFVMLLIGCVIHGNINESLMLKYQEYNTALQIQEDSDLFSYGMRTDVGNAFVYGDLKAVDTVTYPEIGGKYSYIEKIKEEYTRHTRTVTKTRKKSDGSTETYTEEEEYWTWDEVDSWSEHCKKISFLDVEFDYGKIQIPSASYITTIDGGFRTRYVYYGAGIEFTGTLWANLSEDTILNVDFYVNQSIEETIEKLESGWQLVVFWIFWILLIVGCVIGFCYLDNKWLEDKK